MSFRKNRRRGNWREWGENFFLEMCFKRQQRIRVGAERVAVLFKGVSYCFI